jgi:hypothetical protein
MMLNVVEKRLFHFSHGSVAKLSGDMGQFQTTVYKTSPEFYLKIFKSDNFYGITCKVTFFAPQCATSTRCMAFNTLKGLGHKLTITDDSYVAAIVACIINTS